MKRYFTTILALIVGINILTAQNIVKMSAVKSNDYGVAYTLPKTVIKVKADAVKTIRQAGEFYEYAERYLNISDPITKDETLYAITDIKAGTEGIPDTEKSYLVEFRSNTTAPYVTLTRDGLICAINADDADFSADNDLSDSNIQASVPPLPNPNNFLSEETLRAGSKARQAELIARQIFKLRETKTNILTGEADNMPPDGDAYKLVIQQIEEQEKALTSMFKGTEITEYVSETFTVTPTDQNIENQVLFRFSKKRGFVDSDDLSGAPVTLTLINKQPREEPPLLTPKEQKDLEKKFSQGIIYNIPAKADLKVEYANRSWVDKECDVVQYGTQDVLVPKMFDNNKMPVKVMFFPDLGAIKQIIQ